MTTRTRRNTSSLIKKKRRTTPTPAQPAMNAMKISAANVPIIFVVAQNGFKNDTAADNSCPNKMRRHTSKNLLHIQPPDASAIRRGKQRRLFEVIDQVNHHRIR